jgi:hypothetical protein
LEDELKRWIVLVLFALLACSETTGPIPPAAPAGQPARGLLYVLPALGDSVGPVYLADANGSNPRQLQWRDAGAQIPGPLMPLSGPVFSPDGSRLTFVAIGINYTLSPSRVPWLATISDSSARQLGCTRQTFYSRWAPALGFSPDGSMLAYNCARPTYPPLTVIDTGWTKPPQEIPAPQDHLPMGAVAWSPDGKWILNGDLLERTDSTIVQLFMPLGMIGLGWAPNGWIIVGPASLCGTGVYWMPPEPGAKVVKLLDAPYRYAAFSPDSKKLLALTSVCSPTDRPEARLLDRATLAVEWSMPGATWATWRP